MLITHPSPSRPPHSPLPLQLARHWGSPYFPSSSAASVFVLSLIVNSPLPPWCEEQWEREERSGEREEPFKYPSHQDGNSADERRRGVGRGRLAKVTMALRRGVGVLRMEEGCCCQSQPSIDRVTLGEEGERGLGGADCGELHTGYATAMYYCCCYCTAPVGVAFAGSIDQMTPMERR